MARVLLCATHLLVVPRPTCADRDASFGRLHSYFLASAIPHIRDVSIDQWYLHATFWGHAGIYGFTAGMLLKWREISNSNLEKVEKLEQLRLIDSGYKISTFITEEECLSVDTEEQLAIARSKVK